MKRVNNYRVYWEDVDGESYDWYVQATSATQAVELLAVPPELVIEVSVVLKNWKRSK